MNWLKTTFKMVLITEWLGWLSKWITTEGVKPHISNIICGFWVYPRVVNFAAQNTADGSFCGKNAASLGLCQFSAVAKKLHVVTPAKYTLTNSKKCHNVTPLEVNTQSTYTHMYTKANTHSNSLKKLHIVTHTEKNAHKRIKSLQTHTRTQTQTCKKKVLQIVMFAKIHTHA